MIQKSIEYKIKNDTFIGELIYNGELNSTRPVIIIFHAMEGRGHFCIEYAQKLANEGFVTFVADIYGDGKSTMNLHEAREWLMPVISDRNIVRERANAAFNAVISISGVNKNNIGAIGFCLGGMCVLEIARSGNPLRAGVSIHGVLTKSDLLTQEITTKLLVLNGYLDPSCTPDKLPIFADEMINANNHDWVFINFGNAKHSFSDPLTGTFDLELEKQFGREYNELAANRSYRYAIDFFKEVLI